MIEQPVHPKPNRTPRASLIRQSHQVLFASAQSLKGTQQRNPQQSQVTTKPTRVIDLMAPLPSRDLQRAYISLEQRPGNRPASLSDHVSEFSASRTPAGPRLQDSASKEIPVVSGLLLQPIIEDISDSYHSLPSSAKNQQSQPTAVQL